MAVLPVVHTPNTGTAAVETHGRQLYNDFAHHTRATLLLSTTYGTVESSNWQDNAMEADIKLAFSSDGRDGTIRERKKGGGSSSGSSSSSSSASSGGGRGGFSSSSRGASSSGKQGSLGGGAASTARGTGESSSSSKTRSSSESNPAPGNVAISSNPSGNHKSSGTRSTSMGLFWLVLALAIIFNTCA